MERAGFLSPGEYTYNYGKGLEQTALRGVVLKWNYWYELTGFNTDTQIGMETVVDVCVYIYIYFPSSSTEGA